ncbi:MAG: LuxR C-terminal-related transcriptional regulator [Fuerstiella sp.]|jgi:two-component system, LuxR family, response regulator FixJ
MVTSQMHRPPRNLMPEEFVLTERRSPFTVFLIKSDQAVRSEMTAILQTARIDVREYLTATEFYLEENHNVPGVVLIDARIQGMPVAELMTRLQESNSAIQVVAIASRAHVPAGIQLLKQGASDFISRPLDSGELISTIARAYCVHYDIASSTLFDSTEGIVAGLTRLTERERQVLDLLIKGQSSRGISDHLGIRVNTVEAHRSRVNDKMRTRDDAHLIRMCYALPETELV